MENILYEILNLNIPYLTDDLNINYKDRPFLPNVNLIHYTTEENNLNNIDKFIYKRNIKNLSINQKNTGLYILIDAINNCKYFHRITRVLELNDSKILNPNEYKCKIKDKEYVIEIEIFPLNDNWRFD